MVVVALIVSAAYSVGEETAEQAQETLVGDHAVHAVGGVAVVQLLGERLGGVGDHTDKNNVGGVTGQTAEGTGRRRAEGELGHVELLGACEVSGGLSHTMATHHCWTCSP